MRYAHWEDLKPEYQKELLNRERQSQLAKRESLLKQYCEMLGEDEGLAFVDSVWWAKLDYINNWKYPEGYLFDICEDCGCPAQLMNCLKDEPAAYQQRHCVYKCRCGKIHSTCD